MSSRAWIASYVAGALAVALSTATVFWYPVTIALVPIVIGGLVVLVRYPHALGALLLLSALPFARPNIFGEQYSALALVLALAAAIASLAERQRNGSLRYLWITPACVAASYLWILLATNATSAPVQTRYQGLVLTCGLLVAAAVVLADPTRRRIVARGFAIVIVIACASYAVTVLIWLAAGVGYGHVADLQVGALPQKQPVYLPATASAGVTTLQGITFPRFVGIGREPGWMAMYIAFTYMLMPRIGWSSRRIKGLLLIGLLGTLSTAGFGVFVVVWTFERFLRRRPGADVMTSLTRRAVGSVVMVGAVWLAIAAPGFGLQEKLSVNSVSYDDRLTATTAGWRALTDLQFGAGEGLSGINLIATIALAGIPYAALTLAALLLPRFGHPVKFLTTAPVAVLTLTVLLAQPPGESTWVYVLAMLAYVVPLTSTVETHAPTTADQRATSRHARRTPASSLPPTSR